MFLDVVLLVLCCLVPIRSEQIFRYESYRIKRDQSPWFYPEIDKNQISCGPNVYIKLYTCSQLTDCQAISKCLDFVHCPLDMKSFGALIVNLLHLLEINNCQNSTCPNEHRRVILKNLYTYSTRLNDDHYCNSIEEFISKVKLEISSQCPSYFQRVDIFSQNYLCKPNPTTTTPVDLSYIDEDEEFNFINTNTNLVNTTEHTVYINDHQYYNVSYIVSKSNELPRYFVNETEEFIRVHALTNRHRSAIRIYLKFDFPFYGHSINKILIATGGFIYTGDILHSALIGSTQYIAPFMANFDLSIDSNGSAIKYFDNSTHFICTWENVYLQDQREIGAFTFQVILQNTGNIYFNYLRIPNLDISNNNHAHRIGISDAYLSQLIVPVITLYDRINLDRTKIQNGLSIVFNMDRLCNTFTDCATCLANRGKRYNCSWCDDIQKCSDGYDRSRQQWLRAQCHRFSFNETCPNSHEDIFEQGLQQRSASQIQLPSSPMINKKKSTSFAQIFRTIILTLFISVVLLALTTLAVTSVYAYRNPTSPAGMWLVEHRPSIYISRLIHRN